MQSEKLAIEAQVVRESVFSAMERRDTEDGLSKRESKNRRRGGGVKMEEH